VEETGDPLPRGAEIARRPYAVPTGSIGTVRENADANRAEPAAVSVDRDGAARIVDLEDALVEEHAQADDDAGHHADDHGRVRVDEGARRGDRDEPGEH